MENKKFLTVMAVFDADAQEKMACLQRFLIENVGEGTQTMGIPFHVTLGSYEIGELDEVIAKIKKACAETQRFELELLGRDSFGDKVLFLAPQKSDELVRLRSLFENDYAHGYEWVPHATLFCGEKSQIKKARKLLDTLDLPRKAIVVGIELGEFFPARKIIRIDFKDQEIL